MDRALCTALPLLALATFWYVASITVLINWHAGLAIGLATVVVKGVINGR
jgi:hypothetical protein